MIALWEAELPLLDSHALLQPRENDLSPNILDLYSSALATPEERARLTTSSFPTHNIPKNSPIRFGGLPSVFILCMIRGTTHTNNLKHSFHLHTLIPPRSGIRPDFASEESGRNSFSPCISTFSRQLIQRKTYELESY
jgi:hypothetical protein